MEPINEPIVQIYRDLLLKLNREVKSENKIIDYITDNDIIEHDNLLDVMEKRKKRL